MNLLASAVVLVACTCVAADSRINVGDIKPGHDMVKEYHMHPYFFQTNDQQVIHVEYGCM